MYVLKEYIISLGIKYNAMDTCDSCSAKYANYLYQYVSQRFLKNFSPNFQTLIIKMTIKQNKKIITITIWTIIILFKLRVFYIQKLIF